MTEMGKMLAWLVIGIQFLAGIGYLFSGDYRRAAYWILAAAIGVTVTI